MPGTVTEAADAARSGTVPLLAVEAVTKTYPGVVANHEVSITLEPGEIHTVLGENGAGKTTLMALIYGLQRADSGRIVLDGETLALGSPSDALARGIGFVQQHFSLTPTLTVAENLVLALRSSGEKIRMRDGAGRVKELSERYGIDVPAEAVVSTLSVGMQQRAELLKALARDAKVLILDEPTSVLTPAEAEELTAIMRRLADSGVGIFLISHKLEEVLRVSDRITVLRRGKVVGTVPGSGTTRARLAEMMIGEFAAVTHDRARTAPSDADPVLRALDLVVAVDNGRGGVRGVDLELRPGEILGIAGVEGSGQVELVEALAGARAIASGRILLGGVDISATSPRERQDLGVAHIAADRYASGFVPTLSVGDNLVLPVAGDPRFSRAGALRTRAIHEHVERLIAEYDIRVPGPHVEAGTLSGGNQQRLVLARELSREPRVVLSCFATRGLDFASTEAVHRRIRDMRAQGSAVAYASVDLEELLELTDRILVLHEGRVAGLLDTRDATSERLGLLMGGSS